MRGTKRTRYDPRIHLVRKKVLRSPAMTASMRIPLRVRLALRIDNLLQLAEHAHAGKQLRQRGIRLALLLDRSDEFTVLELDAIPGHLDPGDVDPGVVAAAEARAERLERP